MRLWNVPDEGAVTRDVNLTGARQIQMRQLPDIAREGRGILTSAHSVLLSNASSANLRR